MSSSDLRLLHGLDHSPAELCLRVQWHHVNINVFLNNLVDFGIDESLVRLEFKHSLDLLLALVDGHAHAVAVVL